MSDETAGRDPVDREATTQEMPVLPSTSADPVLPYEPITLPSGWPTVVGDEPLGLEFDLPGGIRLLLRTSCDGRGVWTATLAIVGPADASTPSVDLFFFSKVTGATTHGRALRAVALAGIEAGFLRSV